MIPHGICLTYLTECPHGLSMLLQMARFHSFLWLSIIVVVFQLPGCVWLFVTPWTAAHQASCPSPSRSLPKFMFIASLMPSSHLILWCPLLLLPSILPSIRDVFNESFVHIRWWEYWSFSCSISPSSEYSELTEGANGKPPHILAVRTSWTV